MIYIAPISLKESWRVGGRVVRGWKRLTESSAFRDDLWKYRTVPHIYLQSRRSCFRRCLSVCLLASLRKNFQTSLHEVFREGWQRVNEQTIKFWWRSGSPSEKRDCFSDSPSRTDSSDGGTDIETLVRRALAEVCAIPVLLVITSALVNRPVYHSSAVTCFRIYVKWRNAHVCWRRLIDRVHV